MGKKKAGDVPGVVRQDSTPGTNETEKKKQEGSYIHWAFRLDRAKAAKAVMNKCFSLEIFSRVKMQAEIGEKGTKHYQGFFSVKACKNGKGKRRTWLVNFFKKHLFKEFDNSPAHTFLQKSNSSAAEDYCGKEETRDNDDPYSFLKGIVPEHLDITKVTEEAMCPKELMPKWYFDLEAEVENRLPPASYRKIIWIWSAAGEMYKTECCRRLCFNHHAVALSGSQRHVLSTAYKNPAPIYCFIAPASQETGEAAVSYKALEYIRDSLYHSCFGTEATGMVLRLKPWVVVFANTEPEYHQLKKDRWDVRCVDANASHSVSKIAGPSQLFKINHGDAPYEVSDDESTESLISCDKFELTFS